MLHSSSINLHRRLKWVLITKTYLPMYNIVPSRTICVLSRVKFSSTKPVLGHSWVFFEHHTEALSFMQPFAKVAFSRAPVSLWPFRLLNSVSTSFQVPWENSLPVFSRRNNCFVSNHNQLTQMLHLAHILKVSDCCHRLLIRNSSELSWITSRKRENGLQENKLYTKFLRP